MMFKDEVAELDDAELTSLVMSNDNEIHVHFCALLVLLNSSFELLKMERERKE